MEILFGISFLVLIALIIFKKEVLHFLREKTGIGARKVNKDNDENDPAG